MKINLIGMIFNFAGSRPFEGAIIGNNGQPLDAIQSLDTLIMEYAKVRNGGHSDLVALPRSVDLGPIPGRS